jgi:protoheme IX farnesyltransferase
MVDTVINTPVEEEPQIKHYFELLKPRVMRLVVFTAAVGLFCAPVPIHPLIAFASLLCVAIGAGAAGALNMWWDSDIDRIMKRTRQRPIPSGMIDSDEALAVGLVLSVMSVMMLGLFANYFSAALLAFTIFFYIIIYSIWLKRSTPQNIVIGGAAGAFPPMIGWSIATGNVSIESILMFALIFIWTPPHFWTLALFMNEDYSKAKVPMLTVIKGMQTTRVYIFVYTIFLSVVAISISFTAIGGLFYFLLASTLNIWFLWGAGKMLYRSNDTAKADKFFVEKRIFLFSIFYLFAHFMAIAVEVLLKKFDLQYSTWPQIF